MTALWGRGGLPWRRRIQSPSLPPIPGDGEMLLRKPREMLKPFEFSGSKIISTSGGHKDRCSRFFT